MTKGLAGSPDNASRAADMAQWLRGDYKPTPSEIAPAPGGAAEYKVSDLADRNAGIVLRIDKGRRQPLKPAQ